MSLNLKNPETCRLARELADLTGNTLTGAVTVALREELMRERRKQGAAERLKRMRAIARECAALMGEGGPSSTEIGDVLYDEHGLPK